jgi:hypothetical protein
VDTRGSGGRAVAALREDRRMELLDVDADGIMRLVTSANVCDTQPPAGQPCAKQWWWTGRDHLHWPPYHSVVCRQRGGGASDGQPMEERGKFYYKGLKIHKLS